MPFSLDEVVPWGRSFAEYVDMLALDSEALGGRILGCADGPASFAAEAAARGVRVVSSDPLYAFEAAEIERRIGSTFDTVLEETRRNADEFVWQRFESVEALGAARGSAMARFLADYPTGRRLGRYVAATLPWLPFEDDSFDLAVCSHFLFLYGGQLDGGFHVASIVEMLRVAPEARIFPLRELGNAPSRHLDGVVRELSARGCTVTIERVDYEFLRGGDRMLRVLAPPA